MRTAGLCFKPRAVSVPSSCHRFGREILCQDGSHRLPAREFSNKKTLLDSIFRPDSIEASKSGNVNDHSFVRLRLGELRSVLLTHSVVDGLNHREREITHILGRCSVFFRVFRGQVSERV